MANVVHTWKDRDAKRLVKLAKAQGLRVTGIGIDPKTGQVTITTSDGNDAMPLQQPNEWDTVHERKAQKAPARK